MSDADSYATYAEKTQSNTSNMKIKRVGIELLALV